MTDVDVVDKDASPLARVMTPDDLERLKRAFYRAVLDKAEQEAFDVAEVIDGLDKEISTLRTKLRNYIKTVNVTKTQNANFKYMLRGLDTLNRLASTRYRISKKSQKDLMSSMSAMLQGVRAELGIGEDNGT